MKDLIGEITSATLEQSSGIGQVNQAVTQLDQMTQQNAALVEQSAAAAQSLKHQTDELTKAVAIFKVGRKEARQVIATAQTTSKQPPSKASKQAVKPATPARKPPSQTGDDWEEF